MPDRMMPLSGPVRAKALPAPAATPNCTPVSWLTFWAVLVASCAWMVTLKVPPAVGDDGVMAVMASLVGPPVTAGPVLVLVMMTLWLLAAIWP